ncbi:hypothetical protein HAX54_002548 [Datura stramonium]|uniref:Uncharacterized protein n=1 Tax=Datura stramonium TaxID=4076 RepID=A0ABS8WU16_DATST|nr:hypothetical protein [Datura stramonium]
MTVSARRQNLEDNHRVKVVGSAQGQAQSGSSMGTISKHEAPSCVMASKGKEVVTANPRLKRLIKGTKGASPSEAKDRIARLFGAKDKLRELGVVYIFAELEQSKLTFVRGVLCKLGHVIWRKHQSENKGSSEDKGSSGVVIRANVVDDDWMMPCDIMTMVHLE